MSNSSPARGDTMSIEGRDILYRLIHYFLPCSYEEWDTIASYYNRHSDVSGHLKTAVQLRAHFNQIARCKTVPVNGIKREQYDIVRNASVLLELRKKRITQHNDPARHIDGQDPPPPSCDSKQSPSPSFPLLSPPHPFSTYTFRSNSIPISYLPPPSNPIHNAFSEMTSQDLHPLLDGTSGPPSPLNDMKHDQCPFPQQSHFSNPFPYTLTTTVNVNSGRTTLVISGDVDVRLEHGATLAQHCPWYDAPDAPDDY